MALLCRNNISLLPLMSNYRSKVKSLIVKNKKLSFTSNDRYQNVPDNTRSVEKYRYIPYTFSDFINTERLKAKRSILVQVQREKSFYELRRCLLQFGQINAAYHYETKSNHFILIEFADHASIKRVVSSAMFLDRTMCVPVRSNFLWFRSSDEPMNLKHNNQDMKPNLTKGSMAHRNIDATIHNILQRSLSMSDQMLRFLSTVELQELDLRLRFLIAWQIEHLFSNVFDSCQVYPFGSSVNGYGKHACDLDLILNLGEIVNGENSAGNRLMLQTKQMNNFDNSFTKNLLDSIGSIMYHCVPGAVNVKKILNARVPIIKYNHHFTGLECDLSVSNLTAFYMSEFLWLLGKADPRVRPLVYTIRYWARANCLTRESPGPWITNFSLTLLILFFFQQKKILPTLDMLRSNASPKDVRYAGNVDCTFTRDLTKFPVNIQTKSITLDKLLLDFFEYYLTFDFFTNAVDLRSGRAAAKRSASAMYIINPLEPQLNVSKNVIAEEIDKFKGLCAQSIKLCRSMPHNSPKIIMELFSNAWNEPRRIVHNATKKIEVAELLGGHSATDQKPSDEEVMNVAQVKSE